MKETSFIKQNKEKWSKFEEAYSSTKNDPEELSNLYMDMTEDLSYAQTFYKRRTVRVYLNQLSQRIFSGVHKQKGESLKKFFTVWKTSLPLEIYRARRHMLVALISFLVYVAIGAISTHYNPEFAETVLGSHYVDITNANIESGNPLKIYEDDNQLAMFITITTNNLRVAFASFAVGFFFTIGTHLFLLYNGVMLGTFQYFFQTKGLLITSFLGIWIHGAFEISALVIAGGAGITVGNGLLFPKSYTRLQSLQLATRRGLKIMLSLFPFIIAAGFLESYVTHNYIHFPEWSKWAIIFFSFAIILFYYVIYPIYVARKNPHLLEEDQAYMFDEKKVFVFHKIRTIGEIIADSFQFYRSQFYKFGAILFTIILPLSVGVIAMQDYYNGDRMLAEHFYDWMGQLEIMMGYGFRMGTDFIAFFAWTLIFAIMFAAIYWSAKSIDEPFTYRSFFSYCYKRLAGIWIASLLLTVITLALPYQLLLLAFFLLPLFMLNGAAAGLEDSSLGKRLSKGFKASKSTYGTMMLITLLLIAFTAIISQPFAGVFSIYYDYQSGPEIPDLLDMFAGFVKRVATLFTDDYVFWANLVRQAVYLLFVLLIVPIWMITTIFCFYTFKEKTEATGLRMAFEQFGKRKRHQETHVDFD